MLRWMCRPWGMSLSPSSAMMVISTGCNHARTVVHPHPSSFHRATKPEIVQLEQNHPCLHKHHHLQLTALTSVYSYCSLHAVSPVLQVHLHEDIDAGSLSQLAPYRPTRPSALVTGDQRQAALKIAKQVDADHLYRTTRVRERPQAGKEAGHDNPVNIRPARHTSKKDGNNPGHRRASPIASSSHSPSTTFRIDSKFFYLNSRIVWKSFSS